MPWPLTSLDVRVPQQCYRVWARATLCPVRAVLFLLLPWHPTRLNVPGSMPSLTFQAEKGAPFLTHRQAVGHIGVLLSPLEVLKYQNPKQNKNIPKAGGTNPMFKAAVLEQTGREFGQGNQGLSLSPLHQTPSLDCIPDAHPISQGLCSGEP